MKNKLALLALLAVAAVLFAGCTIESNKSADADGSEKVKIAVPMGGLQVKADNSTHAADLGLPDYPGAVQVKDDKGSDSADVSMGFAGYNLRIKVVSYVTDSSAEKVLAFYKKAMRQYGDVIQCQNDKPVGKPDKTAQGLGCADDQKSSLNNASLNDGMSSKAGSKHHQHIVAVDANGVDGKKTKFAQVELELPNVPDNNNDSN